MSDTAQQIKDRLSIVDVVSQYVKLERSGSSLRARCPFHAERTPSFHVSPERGTYHCFGCGVGGDIFSFVEAIEGLDFKGALKVLADKAGVKIVYERGAKGERDERERLFELMEATTIFYSSRLSDAAKNYLKERGLNEATIRAFRIGEASDAWSELSEHLKLKKFTDKEILDAGVAKKNERAALTDKFRNRIMFPINDTAGRVVAFSGRVFGDKASPEAPKYLNSPETPLFRKSRILYGLDKGKLAIRKLGCAVLVEGQIDLVMCHQAGWENTVAASGTAFTHEHAALLRRFSDNLVIALDADEAGIKAAGRAARAALQGGLNVKVAQLPTGLDPADLILKDGADAWKKTVRESKDIISFLLDVLEERAPRPDTFRRNVEAVVLPFLTDVVSPIAREQYVREIASRLKVSESAVGEALSKVPLAPAAPRAGDEHLRAVAPKSGRARQAFALLLWQESLPKPSIDVAAFAKEFEDTLGTDTFSRLMQLPEQEKESLRFQAEKQYARSRALSSDADMQLSELLRSERLPQVHDALLAAQESGDEVEIERLKAVYNVLKTRIAQLRSNV